MTLAPELAGELERAAGRAVTGARRVAGGDINEAWALELAGGGRAFLKTRPDAAPGEFATEAAGLCWLAEPGALSVPEVLAFGDDDGARFLALEWVDDGRLDQAGEEALGRGLAALHAAGAPAFGAMPPGTPASGDAAAPGVPALPGGGAEARVPPLRLGRVVLPNEPLDDWPSFYAERRLRPLARQAADAGALSPAAARAVERVCERLPDLAGPPERPARLHGDLWGGNVLAGVDGRPWLIDPAAHGGHREIDLAMLRLFGGPGPRTIAAYDEAAPLAAGHEDRVELWQLLPLLVHAVLFGGSYGAAVERAARRYVG